MINRVELELHRYCGMLQGGLVGTDLVARGRDALQRKDCGEQARVLRDIEDYLTASGQSCKGQPAPLTYSRHRRVDDWLKVLKKLGDEISEDTFLRRRNGKAIPSYRVNPESTRSSISLAIADLPPNYSDDL